MKFNINGTSFVIETKGVIGYISEDEKLKWAMDIYGAEGKYDGETIHPKFSFTQLAPTQNFKFNEQFIWEKTSAYDKELDDWVGDFLIFDGQYFECSVDLKRINVHSFEVEIKGRVNTNWETAPEQVFVDFEIATDLPFNGIMCEIDSKEKCEKIAGEYLSLDQLDWHSLTDNDWQNSWILPRK